MNHARRGPATRSSGTLTRLAVTATVLAFAMLVVGAAIPLTRGTETATERSLAARSEPTRRLTVPAKPTDLVVPALGVAAPVVPIALGRAGVLNPPRDVDVVGWWKGSARPGARVGQTVLTGHTVHTGGGVLDRLGELRARQVVRVRTPKGSMTYRVSRVQTLTKAQLAARSQSLFNQDRPGNRLVLITCSGWNGSGYDANTVAFAQPRRAEPAGARRR